MDWEEFKNIATLVGLIISILSFLGFGTIMTLFWKDKYNRKMKENETTLRLKQEAEDQRVIGLMKKALETELKSIKDDMVEMKEDLTKLKRSAQCSNRCDLDDIWSQAEKQGWCSSDDKNKFEATYQAYHNLGQNGVMDSKHEKIVAMPEHPSSTRKKRTLVEKA